MLEFSVFDGKVSKAKWVDCKNTGYEKSDKTLSVNDLKELLHFVVLNAFVENDGSLLNQSLGIPMGTNSAPELANLYLYSYESDFIDRLCVTDHKAARDFYLSFRLIDDLLSMDNDAFDVFSKCLEDGGVYPRALACGHTSSSRDRVPFCGLDILTRGKGCAISVYDKKSFFPFHGGHEALRGFLPLCFSVVFYTA